MVVTEQEKTVPEAELGPKMAIADHLNELRKRVVRSVAAIFVLFIAAWIFRTELLEFLLQPHYQAVQALEIQDDQWLGQKIVGELRKEFPVSPQKESIDALVANLEGKTFLNAVKVSEENQTSSEAQIVWERATEIYQTEKKQPLDERPMVTGYTEAIGAYIRACIVVSLLIAGPYVLWQIWGFIAAGLYVRERRFIRRNFPLSLLLFLTGMSFGYFLLIPSALSFLATFGADMVRQDFRISEYFSLFWTLTFVLGLVFQIPVVMVVLSRLGIVHPSSYRKQWRFVFLGSFVASAIVTPTPDPITQSMVALPMYGLYEFGILLSKLAYSDRKKAVEGAV